MFLKGLKIIGLPTVWVFFFETINMNLIMTIFLNLLWLDFTTYNVFYRYGFKFNFLKNYGVANCFLKKIYNEVSSI